MKTDAGNFHFELSLAELRWLAGAFSISRLPLPDETIGGRAFSQLELEQKNGHASLLTRGLVHASPSFGWQVDRLPAAIIHWLASAQSMLRLEYISKSGTTRRMHVFTVGEKGMCVEMNDESAHFILCDTRITCIGSVIQWLELFPTIKKAEKNYQLPQPQIFLPAAWKKPKLTEPMLKTAGIQAKVKETISWVKSLEILATISTIQLDEREFKYVRQFVFCADKKFTWVGNGEDVSKIVSFVPMTIKELTATINNSF